MKYILENQESERLKFRLLEQGDFEAWKNLFIGKDVATFLALDPELTVDELCQFWFEKVFNRYENDLGGMNVLIDKKTQKMIGQCGLLVQTVEDEKRLEIGYSILPEFWGKGFASEASQKCQEYAFKNNFAESLISIIHIDNIASEKVAIKNGLKFEKRVENYMGKMPANIFRVDKP